LNYWFWNVIYALHQFLWLAVRRIEHKQLFQ